MIKIEGTYNHAFIYTDSADAATTGQVTALLNQVSMKDNTIAIMPDCHAGAGCVIGTTMTLAPNSKVVPNLIGVDIGCGVLVVRLNETKISLQQLDTVIRANIPSGFDVRETEYKTAWDARIDELRCLKHVNDDRAYKSIGTLGGGNHFIEVDEDPETKEKYLVIHTGSRNLGKQIAEYYQKLAWQKLKKTDAHHDVPHELAYLEGDDFEDYIHDMKIAQQYAQINREAIADIILKKMKLHEADESDASHPSRIPTRFETVHNYIDMRTVCYNGKYMLRKGAVSALDGEVLIIPINMRDGCLIAIGKGCNAYNQSAPHGAGRLLSRTQAKEQLGMKDFREAMEGIYTTSVNQQTLDESPMAYKPMEAILKNIDDTVDIVKTVVPVYNFKASEDEPSYKKKKRDLKSQR